MIPGVDSQNRLTEQKSQNIEVWNRVVLLRTIDDAIRGIFYFGRHITRKSCLLGKCDRWGSTSKSRQGETIETVTDTAASLSRVAGCI
jgi:hypothetical protein